MVSPPLEMSKAPSVRVRLPAMKVLFRRVIMLSPMLSLLDLMA
jgi:hypothetical protein